MNDKLPAITRESAFAMLRQRCQDLEDLHLSVLDVNNELRAQAAKVSQAPVAKSPYQITEDLRESSAQLLRTALGATQSECGVVGIVMESGVLRLLAHEGIAGAEHSNSLFEESVWWTDVAAGCLELVRLDNVFGRVLSFLQVLLANNTSQEHQACGSLPSGRVSFIRFLGVPAYHDDQLIGMIALAKRGGGYEAEQLSEVKALVAKVGPLSEQYRRSLQLAAVEAQLQQHQSQLRSLLDERQAIGQRLHDDILQTLTSLRSFLDEFSPVLRMNPSSGDLVLEPLIRTLDRLLIHVRGYLFGGMAVGGYPAFIKQLGGIEWTSPGANETPE
jgi:hypothetical protein